MTSTSVFLLFKLRTPSFHFSQKLYMSSNNFFFVHWKVLKYLLILTAAVRCNYMFFFIHRPSPPMLYCSSSLYAYYYALYNPNVSFICNKSSWNVPWFSRYQMQSKVFRRSMRVLSVEPLATNKYLPKQTDNRIRDWDDLRRVWRKLQEVGMINLWRTCREL